MNNTQKNHLVKVLRSASIEQLDAIEKMNKKQLNHLFKSISEASTVDLSSASITPETVKTLIANEINANTAMNTSNLPLVTPTASFRAPVAAAQFTLNITRNSANIAAILPVPLFGILDKESSYKEIVAQSLPSGTTFSLAVSPTGKGIRYTYVNGGNTDTIDVECPQVPYVNLLRASQGSILTMTQNKMTIDDVANQSQFSQAVEIVHNTLFGKFTSDSFTPNDYKSDLQNQNDIRIFTNIITIDQETTLLFQSIAEATGFSLTSFVHSYSTARA